MPLVGVKHQAVLSCAIAAAAVLQPPSSWLHHYGGPSPLNVSIRCSGACLSALQVHCLCSFILQGVPLHLFCGSAARQCTCSAAVLPTQVKLLEQNEDRFGAKGSPDTHFGHDVIPHALRDKLKVVAHHFTGYWRVSLIMAGSNEAITATLAATHDLSSQCCKALFCCCSLLTAPAVSLVVRHGRPHQVAMVPLCREHPA